MPKVATLDLNQLSLKQQEAFQWMIDNRRLLNCSGIEQLAGCSRNCIQKHVAGHQNMSQTQAIKLADFIIAWRS